MPSYKILQQIQARPQNIMVTLYKCITITNCYNKGLCNYISYHHSPKYTPDKMKNVSKLPYKVQFEPEYEQYNQRLARLPVPTEPQFQVSDVLIKLVDQVKEKLKEEDLEYFPSNIYSQYATPTELKNGKKNVSDNCPGCGDQLKKQVQCEFCAVVYCKNCCWRKRVLPNLSQPKQSRPQCQECHAKFVKLLANQKFYQETTVMQKIIDNSNTKLKKLEKDMKTKKERIEVTEKKKKQNKIKQGILLKQLKNQEKKVQQLQEKLQEVVKAKAQALRKQQERVENEKKVKQEQQAQQKRKTEEIEQTLRRQRQLQLEKEANKKKQEETERQLKQEMERAEKQKQRQIQLQKQRKIEQQQAKKQRQVRLKRLESEQRHLKQTQELRNLAKTIAKQPEHFEQKQHFEAPPLVVMVSATPQKQHVFIESESNKVVASSPIKSISPDQKPTVNNSFQESSPLRVMSSFNGLSDTVEQNAKKSTSSSNTKESIAKLNSNLTNEKQKTQVTETTQKSVENQEQLSQKDQEKVSKQQDQKAFLQMPPIAINVAQMTVNELLGIHVNPNANNMPMNRRLSQRESYLRQDKTNTEAKKFLEQTPKEEEQIKQITDEEKYEILRSSNLSSSLLHSNHNEEEAYADPVGTKCNCNVM